MKNGCLLVIAFLTATAKIKAQHLPSHKEQYAFLTWYLAETKPQDLSKWLIHLSPAKLKTPDNRSLKKLKVTSAEDRYLLRQLADAESKKTLDTASLRWEWKDIPKDAELPGTLISLPIFTRDRRLAIIYKYYGNKYGNEETVKIHLKIKPGIWRLCGIQPYLSWEMSSIDD